MGVFFGKDEPPKWLSIIGLIIIVIFVVGEFDSVSFLAGIIAILCARQCYKWSRKINRKGYLAYFIGLLFSLLGLLFYYLFYRTRVNKPHNIGAEKTTKTTETSEEKAKRLIKEYIKNKTGAEDFDSHYLGEEYTGYFIELGGKDLITLNYSKDDLIKEVIKNNFDVKKVVANLVEEYEVKKETKKIKERDRKLRIKEKAERRFYGKVKTKRTAMKSEEKEAIFRKFGNKCTICGRTEGLHIHHKNKDPKNNRMDNLIVLCGVCHKKIHMKVR